MATYSELHGLFGKSNLRYQIEVACLIAAETIRNELDTVPNHDNRLIWAKRAFTSPRAVASEMLMALLAANKDVTVANIIGASDEQIQTKVDAAVDIFADGS